MRLFNIRAEWLLTFCRWIFILEGILTVLVAVLAFFTLYDFPETAGFLTEEERAFVVWRLKYQGASDTMVGGKRVAQDDTFQWKFVKSAFLDWQIWTNIWVYWGMSTLDALKHLQAERKQALFVLCMVYHSSCHRLSVVWVTHPQLPSS